MKTDGSSEGFEIPRTRWFFVSDFFNFWVFKKICRTSSSLKNQRTAQHWYFLSVLWCSHTGNHAHKAFGYRWDRKVQFCKESCCILATNLLKLILKIWWSCELFLWNVVTLVQFFNFSELHWILFHCQVAKILPKGKHCSSWSKWCFRPRYVS